MFDTQYLNNYARGGFNNNNNTNKTSVERRSAVASEALAEQVKYFSPRELSTSGFKKIKNEWMSETFDYRLIVSWRVTSETRRHFLDHVNLGSSCVTSAN